MEEEFIIQVTEEELSQFPEEETEESKQDNLSVGLRREELQGIKLIGNIRGSNNTNKTQVNIPSLLDLKLPRLYAASRNGQYSRQNKESTEEQSTRWRRGPRMRSWSRSNTPRRYRWGQRSFSPTPQRRRRTSGSIHHETDAVCHQRTTQIISPDGRIHAGNDRKKQET